MEDMPQENRFNKVVGGFYATVILGIVILLSLSSFVYRVYSYTQTEKNIATTLDATHTQNSLLLAQLQEEQEAADKEEAQPKKKPSTETPKKKPPTQSSAKTYPEKVAAASSLKELFSVLDSFGEKYGLDFKTESKTRTYSSFKALAESDLATARAYAKMFVIEWDKYTVNWIKNSGVKEIYIVKSIKNQNTPVAAVPIDGYAVGYDINYGTGEYAQKVVHHEFFHCVDYNRFGNNYYYNDPDWYEHNPSGFTYGAGGSAAYDDPNYAYAEHPQDGFVTAYATYGEEEDRAETYSFMMEGSLLSKLKKWKKSDPYLAAKYKYMVNLMKSYDSTITDSYFSFTY